MTESNQTTMTESNQTTMTESNQKFWYLIQFHKTDDKRARLVNKALYNGYQIAERLLEDCMFVVSVTSDGVLSVDADNDCSSYIEGTLKASVSKWNEEVFNELEKYGSDNLDSCKEEEDWMDSEVHLTNNLNSYLEDGIVIE